MDPETPRTLGDLEDSEPERRPATRSNQVKKTLDEFLVSFEERLREHPGEAATSATAALEGRADGSWRTPVEGGERSGRRLPRRVPRRRPEGEPLPDTATATAETSPAPPTLPKPSPGAVDAGDQELAAVGADPAAAVFPDSLEAADPTREPATTEPAAAAKRRNRHRRRHRHR